MNLKTLLLSCALLLPVVSHADLTILTEDSPPFQYKNAKGEIVGMAADIVKEMMKRSGVPMKKHDLVPWQRAYAAGKDEANTCVYATTELPERMPLFKWVTPVINNDWVLLVPADSKLTATKLEDLKGKTFGGYLGDAVAAHLKKEGYKVDEASSDDLNVQKLTSGRFDVWATSGVVGPYLAKQKGVTNLKQLLAFKKTTMSLACNKGISDDIIKKLNDTLAAMHADGTVDKIIKSY